MEQNNEENAGLFMCLPLELLIDIFSHVSLTDLVLLSSTCQYWRLNAWAFVVTLDPIEFQQLVKKVADHASFEPNISLDLFSDEVAPPVQENQPNQVRIFDFLFERIEQSVLQVDHFTLDGSLDGWNDIKLDLLDALEKYPGFFKQLKKLKLNHLSLVDLDRVLKMSRSLEILDLRTIPDANYQLVAYAIENKFDNLTALTISNCDFTTNYDIIDQRLPSTSLRSLKFESGKMRYIHQKACFPHLTYLGFIDIDMEYDYSNVIPTSAPDYWPNLKVLDVCGTGYRDDASLYSVKNLPKYLRRIFRKAQQRGLPYIETRSLDSNIDEEDDEDPPEQNYYYHSDDD